QQPASAAAPEGLILLARLVPGLPQPRKRACGSSVAEPMGPVIFRIKLIHALGAGTRAGEAESAFLALDGGEPKAGAAGGRVRRLDQRLRLALATEETGGVFPDDRGGGCGGAHAARKQAQVAEPSKVEA